MLEYNVSTDKEGDELDKDKLIEALKHKITVNASYFILNKNVKLDDIEIEKGAMLLPSAAIPVSNIAYFNVLYRYNWDREHIEGFVAIALEELADLVIDNSITVYYTGKNSKDTEIYERILKERDEINAGN